MSSTESPRRDAAPALSRLLTDCVMARAALGACGFPIAILDDSATNRPVTYVNAAFESFFGCRADEAIGRGLGSLVFRGDEALVHRMAAEQAPRRTVSAWARDGSLKHVELSLAAVRANDGRITHWVAAFSDRSELESQRTLAAAA